MKKTIALSSASLIFSCMSVFAGTMGTLLPESSPWYIAVNVGYSFAMDANISVNPAIWDNATQGYSDNLGATTAVGLGIGTYIGNAFHIDLRGERRGDYKYSKFQTGSSATPGFTGDVRTRSFKVTSNALMLSGWLDLGTFWNNLVWNVGAVSLQPFVGAGVGVNYMDVHDFHTVGAGFGSMGRYQIGSINSSSTGSDVAWHGAAGLSAQITPKATLSVGYNYFDGGKLSFPSYIDSSTSSPDAALGRNGVTVTPWKGRLQANEVFAELRIRI